MPEFIVSLPIDPVSRGEMWISKQPLPRHCTLMGFFEIYPSQVVPFEEKLSDLARDTASILLNSEKQALFGPTNDVPVHVLERRHELTLLHTQLFMYLVRSASAAEFLNLNWVGAGYNPHVTIIDGKGLPLGSSYYARNMALIERRSDGSRIVRSAYPFSV